MLCLLASVMAVSAFAAPRMKDLSDTHVYNSDNSDKVPFDKKDITINIHGKDYAFTASGSGTWKNVDQLPELNLPDEGEDAYLPVVITDEDGIVYNAYLNNHSDKNGNNGNARPGTDTYDISGVSQVNPDPDPQNLDPDPVDPTPDPVDPTPDPDPVDPNPDPDPVDPTSDPDPVDPNPDPDPVDPNPDPDPVDPNPDPDPVDPNPDPDPVDPNPDPDPVDPNPDPSGGEPVPFDDDVPLAEVPKTGDPSLLWAAVSALSAGSLALVNRKKKEE